MYFLTINKYAVELVMTFENMLLTSNLKSTFTMFTMFCLICGSQDYILRCLRLFRAGLIASVL